MFEYWIRPVEGQARLQFGPSEHPGGKQGVPWHGFQLYAWSIPEGPPLLTSPRARTIASLRPSRKPFDVGGALRGLSDVVG
eukprot:3991786-Pyramimonas_sp.AAC.1